MISKVCLLTKNTYKNTSQELLKRFGNMKLLKSSFYTQVDSPIELDDKEGETTYINSIFYNNGNIIMVECSNTIKLKHKVEDAVQILTTGDILYVYDNELYIKHKPIECRFPSMTKITKYRKV